MAQRYLDELDVADVRELAIHRRVSRLNYSQRCAEASDVQNHMKQGLPLAPGMEIGYVIKDAHRWKVDPERTASKFDAVYYRGLLDKAWGEEAFVFSSMTANDQTVRCNWREQGGTSSVSSFRITKTCHQQNSLITVNFP